MVTTKSKAAPAGTKKMPVTLRSFSQWLDWVAAGKPRGGLVEGEDAPPGELYSVLVYEALAKVEIAVLDRDRVRAVEWLDRYRAVGQEVDPSVTDEFKFTELPGRTVPEKTKVNSERLKSRYPAVWAQCRDWTPYRSVKLSKNVVDVAPLAEPEGGWLPEPIAIEALAANKSQWPVSWGQAYARYRERLEQLKKHRQVEAQAVETMHRLLTDPLIQAEYAASWDGHGVLEFDCGTKIQLDRLQFSQDRAAEVLPNHPGVDLDSVTDTVPEHVTSPTRKLVKVGYEKHGESETTEEYADPNPFEGN